MVNPVDAGFNFLKDFISCLPQPILSFLNFCLFFFIVTTLWRIISGVH